MKAFISSSLEALYVLNFGKFSLKPFPISSFHVVTLPGPSPVGCYPKSPATSCGRKASLCSRPKPLGGLDPHPLTHTFAITPLTGAFPVPCYREIVLYSGENIRIHKTRLISLPWVHYYPAKPTPHKPRPWSISSGIMNVQASVSTTWSLSSKAITCSVM